MVSLESGYGFLRSVNSHPLGYYVFSSLSCLPILVLRSMYCDPSCVWYWRNIQRRSVPSLDHFCFVQGWSGGKMGSMNSRWVRLSLLWCFLDVIYCYSFQDVVVVCRYSLLFPWWGACFIVSEHSVRCVWSIWLLHACLSFHGYFMGYQNLNRCIGTYSVFYLSCHIFHLIQ